MSTQNIFSCDFCKKTSYNAGEVLFERVVIKDGRQSPKWEDICQNCYIQLTKFIAHIKTEKKMNQTIVIYHGGCRDGFCAAWVVNKYFTHKHNQSTAYPEPNTEVKFIPGFYGQEPPDVKDKDVIIVDFCYPLEQMKQIADDCNNLIWLDHHKTAQPFVDWLQNIIPDKDGIYWIFDNNHSGAGIAWDYFFPNEPRPWIVNYVEDRDLWLNKLWRSEEINAYIACLEFSFDIWDSALAMSIEDAFYAGQVARRKTEQYVREVCKNVYFSDIFGVDTMEGLPVNGMQPIYKEIPTVNICQVDCSEVLHALCEKYPSSPFSMYWMKRADGMYQYGLRSIGDFDVSAVAKLFGGGGHKNAAGFQLNYLLEELK